MKYSQKNCNFHLLFVLFIIFNFKSVVFSKQDKNNVLQNVNINNASNSSNAIDTGNSSSANNSSNVSLDDEKINSGIKLDNRSVKNESVILKAEVDKANCSIDESIIFKIILKYNKDLQHGVEIPEVGNLIQGLRIADFGVTESKVEDNLIIKERWYKLQADIAGSYILPSVDIEYINNQNKKEKVSTSQIFIEVTSFDSNTQVKDDKNKERQDIRDIKPIIILNKQNIFIFIIIAIIILILIIFGIIFYLRKKRKKIKIVDEKSPYEIVLSQIDYLKNTKWLEENNIKKFHFYLSELIREYIEKIFLFPATDRTTYEIERNISNLELSNEQKNILLEILHKTDVIKFTDIVYSNEVSLQILNKTEEFINSTKPQEEENLSEHEDQVI